MPPKTSPPRLTHFLCIPLITNTTIPHLRASLQNFRRDAESTLKFNTSSPESSSSDNVISPNLDRAVRPLGTLHLTLGVMSLLSEERVNSALHLLESLDLGALFQKSISQSSDLASLETADHLNITLRGLSSMHNPSKTSILYVSPSDPKAYLQRFCQGLRTIFQEAGLLITDTRPLLLHATVFNTIYMAKSREKGGRNYGHGKFRAKTTVDARDLMELWKDKVWVEDGRVENVTICRMGAQKVDGGEEYVVEGEKIM